MKKIFLPVLAVVALLAMSFTTANNSKKIEIVHTEDGYKLTNVDMLSTMI